MSTHQPSPPATPVPSPVLRPRSPPTVSKGKLFMSRQAMIGSLISIGVLLVAFAFGKPRYAGYCVLLLMTVFSLMMTWRTYEMFRARIHEPDTSLMCVAEIQVDADTVVTVRSWWPTHLSVEAVRINGERVALQNAQEWVDTNRDPSDAFELDLTEDIASHILEQYLTTSAEEHTCSNNQCSVCLDDLDDTDKVLTLTDCNHTFHASCLSFWFCKSSKIQCPNCRKDHAPKIPEHELPRKRKDTNVLTLVSLEIRRGRTPGSRRRQR